MKYRAYSKVNIFLKIVGVRDSYHKISSRFMLINSLYDELWFEKKIFQEEFELHGNFGCSLDSNTIYKAYKELLKEGYLKSRDFMSSNSLHVKKNIPSFAGLGGGSSDAATFLKMINKEASLGIDLDKLSYIGSKVGADIPFFVYGYSSANISEVGEIVEEFKEDILNLEIFTPKVECNTAKVYQQFRENLKIDKELYKELENMQSDEILSKFEASALNDLFNPAKELYPKLKEYDKSGWFFSGSGSSFFRIEDEI